ncbi:2-succinyl-6-hydroxy-2,4-cyclohexadiene-1-carboxylate synthase [Scytonema hofmannii FACHB-248]|uniref:Putative 2-succinyl-6-hydroxy-2,4-cyclohexadiene-1-carboxylate synthase n=1 Tax=Scytonema hofmannii FACHB-248 TaxID=1842502 RepID=A0ABR8GLB1_9CYAN|nr:MULTISPECIES: 2-succinyl-6-hydroxy-2,4-cyclohexadiene-1-carboxylate synthase [Nostocales]MBD2603938.1 2-succinyl-6-hydroxy-2,4-cyclohexadiene-1-carboxylate synthase [Scytonema hofmannii FACHB-248]
MSLETYQFYYSFTGNSQKKTILFLHGFMGNCHDFDETIKFLVDDFYCLTIDLPGHGKTQVFGGDECYTMANTAQALINLLDNLKIAQCFLVGYSMGGRLALYLNLLFPQRFSKVILESASPGLITEAERLERVKSDEQIATKLTRCVEETDFRVFLLNWYNQRIFGYIKNHSEFEGMIESRLQNNPLELAKSLRFMGTGCQPSLWEQLEENTNSLLLLVGEYDEKFIIVNIKMVNICKFTQLKIISNSGHNIHFENTFAFVQNIRKFLI